MVKGYKVFNKDWTCGNKQYSCPGVFEEYGKLEMCKHGMHFCKIAAGCFSYYRFDAEKHVAEVIASGTVLEEENKCCTDKLEIVREIPWDEVLQIVNTGKKCTGFSNSGNWNSGNYNSGDCNSGDYNSGIRNSGHRNSGNYNSGNCNSGDYNSGKCNSGNYNSGHRNSGHRNSGNYNSGNCNSGDYNSGKCNSGNCNSGDYNSGIRNSGNRNSGNYNSGNCNSGNCNSGDCNSGNRNSGHRNSGNYNSGDYNNTCFSNGCFNTVKPKIYLFDKPSDWTFLDWRSSEAYYLMSYIDGTPLEWIRSDDMTDEEKAAHPEHQTTGGYLEKLDTSECAQIWWNGLSDHQRNIIKAIPNFDPEIFRKITGIRIED